MSLLDEIRSTLDAAGIRHALIGALALSVHGVNRATVDVDLLITDTSCLSPDFWAGLRNRAIVVDIRKGDASDPLAGVVRFRAAEEGPVDLVVGRFSWQERLLERAVPAGGDAVVRAADLVLLKLYAGGPQDAWDIQQLLALPIRQVIVSEVESRLQELPSRCQTLWTQIRQNTPE